MTPIEVTVARIIRTKRAESGLSCKELAERIDCYGAQQIYNWENAKYAPGAHSLCLLADVFGCTVDELLGRDGK